MKELKEMDTMDLTPTWEATARILIMTINSDLSLTDPEQVSWAESEIVRMGKIIDHLTESK